MLYYSDLIGTVAWLLCLLPCNIRVRVSAIQKNRLLLKRRERTLHWQKLIVSKGLSYPPTTARVNFYGAFMWQKVVSASRVTFVCVFKCLHGKTLSLLAEWHSFVCLSVYMRKNCLTPPGVTPPCKKGGPTPGWPYEPSEMCHINASRQGELKWMQSNSWLNVCCIRDIFHPCRHHLRCS